MTNNPTIDGVSRELRELLERVVGKPTGKPNWDALDETRIAAAEELRALLDAPVVERQPDAYIVESVDPSSGNIRRRGLHWHSTETLKGTRDFKEWAGENTIKEQALYTDSPEVAALQSTIAELQARVQELESWRGEPAYQVSDGVNGWRDVERLKFTACQLDPEEYECRMLFAAPPAPVAVILPERGGLSNRPNFNEGWNACLDATAALNTIHVGELDPAQRLALARGGETK